MYGQLNSVSDISLVDNLNYELLNPHPMVGVFFVTNFSYICYNEQDFNRVIYFYSLHRISDFYFLSITGAPVEQVD